MVSEWRSVIAVSLNVGSGICLIKPAKLYMCVQNTTNNEDGGTVPGVCSNGSVRLSHSGNVVTRIGIHAHTHTHFLFLINQVQIRASNMKMTDLPTGFFLSLDIMQCISQALLQLLEDSSCKISQQTHPCC